MFRTLKKNYTGIIKTAQSTFHKKTFSKQTHQLSMQMSYQQEELGT